MQVYVFTLRFINSITPNNIAFGYKILLGQSSVTRFLAQRPEDKANGTWTQSV